jgi:hypothetical protein
VPQLQVIDDALWQAVKDREAQVMQATRPDSRSPPKPFHRQGRPKFLLTGLIPCGSCGAGYVKVGQHRFGCASVRTKGAAPCTNVLTVRREAFEEIVIAGLKHCLMDPELFKTFPDAFLAAFDRSRIEQRASRAAGELELQRTDKRIRRILDLLLGSDAAPRSLMEIFGLWRVARISWKRSSPQRLITRRFSSPTSPRSIARRLPLWASCWSAPRRRRKP